MATGTGHARALLDQALHLVVGHQQLVQPEPALVTGLVALVATHAAL